VGNRNRSLKDGYYRTCHGGFSRKVLCPFCGLSFRIGRDHEHRGCFEEARRRAEAGLPNQRARRETP
jgi:hypothetical protein